MFWRFKEGKDGKDNFGRTFEEAWQEHALWCLDTVKKNKSDDEDKMNYIYKNSSSCLECPLEFRGYLSGKAVFNAYCEIKTNLKSFEKYYTEEEIGWISSYLKDGE